VVLGAGGAARAIAVELALANAANIIIVNRVGVTAGGNGQRSEQLPERGKELADLLVDKLNIPARFVPWQGNFQLPTETDVLVNATSIGLGDSQARVPLALDILRPNMIVADVIINPPRTRLLREAAAQECRTLDGLSMLVNQAAIAFRIWTGQEADTTLLREDVEEYLNL
jgi:shikimate dehydrogenase